MNRLSVLLPFTWYRQTCRHISSSLHLINATRCLCFLSLLFLLLALAPSSLNALSLRTDNIDKLDPPSEGKYHIVYVLNASASMNMSKMIDKAQKALNDAIDLLSENDTFNIVTFDKSVRPFENEMVKATKENLKRAHKYINNIKVSNMSNLSKALEFALSMKGATQMYVMSNEEPELGIVDLNRLCKFVKDHNDQHIQINALAFGTGKDFRRIKLLDQIAKENNGTYQYINMAK